MGGFGSGRRDGRTLVEDCLALDIAGLVRDGLIMPGGRKASSLHWREIDTGREVGSVSYEADMTDAGTATLRLSWRTGSGGDARARSVTIRLATTRQRLGGVRWWFLCPITGKRAGKLHLPPGGDAFASRQALGLAYHSHPHRRPVQQSARQALTIRSTLASSAFAGSSQRRRGGLDLDRPLNRTGHSATEQPVRAESPNLYRNNRRRSHTAFPGTEIAQKVIGT